MYRIFYCSNFDGKGNEILINLDKVIYIKPEHGFIQIQMVDDVVLNIPESYWGPLKTQLVSSKVSMIVD